MRTLDRISFALFASTLTAKCNAIAVDTTRLHPGDDAGSYDVNVQVSQAGGGSTWTYTITKTADDAKDLGHFILSFDTCGGRSPTLASILSATVNGVNWLDHIDATWARVHC